MFFMPPRTQYYHPVTLIDMVQPGQHFNWTLFCQFGFIDLIGNFSNSFRYG